MDTTTDHSTTSSTGRDRAWRALTGVAAVAVAIGALRTLRLPVIIAALVLQVGSIAALVASRGPGIFGWTETGYEGETLQILLIEIVASGLLIAALVLDRRVVDEKS